jgi:predicted DNA-binding antitoxin AbrB/MazE fold protein
MSYSIPAIFDAGVFRPLEPVDLVQGTRVDVQVSTAGTMDALSEEELARQHAAIARFFAVMDALPAL